MHGAVLQDKAGRVLRPSILRNGSRSHAEAAQLDANPIVRNLSGNIVFPGFTAPKLMWVRTHEPDIFAAATKVLLPKDYLNFWLTGRYWTEMSDAACGVGALCEGQGFVSLGTSGVLLAARDSFAPMPASAVHTFCHAIPGTWYQMGVILAATDSLNWLGNVPEA